MDFTEDRKMSINRLQTFSRLIMIPPINLETDCYSIAVIITPSCNELVKRLGIMRQQ